MTQCRAQSKRSQQRCRKPATPGHAVCHMHGSKSFTGLGSRTYRHGKYSKVLPVQLQGRYEQARTDKSLLSVREDIAVAEARLADLFSRIDTGESGHLWHELRQTVEAFSAAMQAGEVPAMQRHFATMRQLVTQGSDDAQAWRDIQQLWLSRCRLTETEIKTLATAQQMVTVEQVMTYFGLITETIVQTVQTYADVATARQILADLSSEFARISALEAALT